MQKISCQLHVVQKLQLGYYDRYLPIQLRCHIEIQLLIHGVHLHLQPKITIINS